MNSVLGYCVFQTPGLVSEEQKWCFVSPTLAGALLVLLSSELSSTASVKHGRHAGTGGFLMRMRILPDPVTVPYQKPLQSMAKELMTLFNTGIADSPVHPQSKFLLWVPTTFL